LHFLLKHTSKYDFGAKALEPFHRHYAIHLTTL
jgi:hypothetical protein